MTRLKIKYLALFRDLTGLSEEDLDIQGEAVTVREIIEILAEKYPSLKSYVESEEVIVVADGKPLQLSEKVSANSELLIMPPISGGSSYAFIDKIDPPRVLDGLLKSLDDKAGAVMVFIGRVKGSIEGNRVNELYYEVVEPLSTSTLSRIGEEESKNHGLIRSVIYHKKGSAKPGEPVLFIAVASEGRKEALQALQSILERVKHEAYVWKLERREDGDYWIIGDHKRVPRQPSSNA
ncbi:MAG: molybdenum cofactor biosynthesis protein MoaE [Infirmifilum sp.]